MKDSYFVMEVKHLCAEVEWVIQEVEERRQSSRQTDKRRRLSCIVRLVAGSRQLGGFE